MGKTGNLHLGGPGGFGKSELVKRLIEEFESDGKRVVLTAPTWHAAHQLHRTPGGGGTWRRRVPSPAPPGVRFARLRLASGAHKALAAPAVGAGQQLACPALGQPCR
jgi:hypothetical protein